MTTSNTYSILANNRSLLEDADTFIKILLYKAQDTLLPEIYNIFGKEDIQKFLDVFAGAIIKVPELNLINECAKLSVVYTTIQNARDTGDALDTMAVHYKCSKKDVTKWYLIAQEIIEGCDNSEALAKLAAKKEV